MLSHNLFGYCVNDPINSNDPLGKSPFDAVKIGANRGNNIAVIVAYSIDKKNNPDTPGKSRRKTATTITVSDFL